MYNSSDLTIVIPTYSEKDSVANLIRDLKLTLLSTDDMSFRLLFVDDSPDDSTVAAIEAVAMRTSEPRLRIDYVHRPLKDQDGLAGAVIYGIRQATTDLVVVMDGDGQHPPKTITSMMEAIRTSEMDVVVASRYCRGGSAEGLANPVRHVISRLSTWAAKAMFPNATRGISDPLTGFFLLRVQSIDLDLLSQAAGFKVLLELLVQHPRLRKTQVPLQFAARNDGVSKGTVTQGWIYLRQLIRLRFTPVSLKESH